LGSGPAATFLLSNDDGSCPPGTAAPRCADSTIVATLAAGTYTLAVTVFDTWFAQASANHVSWLEASWRVSMANIGAARASARSALSRSPAFSKTEEAVQGLGEFQARMEILRIGSMGSPLSITRMLPGFRSRWITRLRCA
jgi:hypothetical protein